MAQPEPVICAVARTPIGKFLGSLSTMSAVELGIVAVKAVIERSGVDPAIVDEVLLGQVLQGGAGQAPARQVAIKEKRAGPPMEVPHPPAIQIFPQSWQP